MITKDALKNPTLILKFSHILMEGDFQNHYEITSGWRTPPGYHVFLFTHIYKYYYSIPHASLLNSKSLEEVQPKSQPTKDFTLAKQILDGDTDCIHTTINITRGGNRVLFASIPLKEIPEVISIDDSDKERHALARFQITHKSIPTNGLILYDRMQLDIELKLEIPIGMSIAIPGGELHFGIALLGERYETEPPKGSDLQKINALLTALNNAEV